MDFAIKCNLTDTKAVGKKWIKPGKRTDYIFSGSFTESPTIAERNITMTNYLVITCTDQIENPKSVIKTIIEKVQKHGFFGFYINESPTSVSIGERTKEWEGVHINQFSM